MTAVTPTLSQKFKNLSLVCSFLVVVIHCVNQFGVSYAPIRMVIYDGICRVAVPFFFFASGFFLYKHVGERNWYVKELAKRVRSLVIPFLVLTLLYWVLHYNTPLSVLAIFGLDVHTWPLLGPLWYVRGLLVLMILTPILARLASWGGVICLFLLYGALAPWEGLPGYMIFFFRKVVPLQGAFYFTLGMACRKRSIDMIGIGTPKSLLLLSTGLLLLVVKVLSQYLGFTHYLYFGWASIPLIVVGAINLMPEMKIGDSITSCAFPIFLAHMFVVDIVVAICRCIGFSADQHLFIWCCLVVFIVLLTFSIVYIQRRYLSRLNQILYGGR